MSFMVICIYRERTTMQKDKHLSWRGNFCSVYRWGKNVLKRHQNVWEFLWRKEILKNLWKGKKKTKHKNNTQLTIMLSCFKIACNQKKSVYVFPQWINNHSFIPAMSMSSFTSQHWDENKQTLLFPLICGYSMLPKTCS